MLSLASDHIKPCNIGQSEAHNKRTRTYMAHINKDNIYLRTDLMSENESWISPLMGNMSLQEYYDLIARMVKEKTGRSLQTKERTRIDKKTGKVTKVNGSSPIRESVVVCKEGTTMDELQSYCEQCHEAWGITALQIHIHRDEGHFTDPKNRKAWKPNYHAHIIWDWMNHDTGKSIKLAKEDMSRMQSMVAEALGMERGKSKEETGSVHLERNDFIIAKQRKQSELLDAENRTKELRSMELDNEIVAKQNQANAENGNAILSGVAHWLGKGKYVELEKENERLKAEVPKLMEQQKAIFKSIVKQEVKKETALLQQQLFQKTVEAAQNKQHWIAWQQKAQDTETELQSLKKILNDRTESRQTALELLSAFLIRTDALFNRAVQALITFVKSEYQYILHNEQAIAIKSTIEYFADTPKEKAAIGKVLVNAAIQKAKLNRMEERKAFKEVDAVVAGGYDRKIEKNGGLSY